MWPWVAAAIGGVLLLLFAAYLVRRLGRTRHYQTLAASRIDTIKGREPTLAERDDFDALQERFQSELIVRAERFLDDASLERIRQEGFENEPRMIRSYIPGHKKGGTLSYEQIHACAPHALAFYHSPRVQEFISRVVGEKIGPTADHDQSSLSVLCYDQEGDHINWHFDHNFYKGRHFTVLLSIVNESAEGGVSAGKLFWKNGDGKEVAVDTSRDVLVIFEGAKVLHKASPIAKGDTRMMLSMTYATTPEIGWFKDTIRRFKDTAYYGLRVLWD
ncbi:MAG: 2OG-Fe(II) oxygenase [Pirellulaceae bacterium]